MNVQMVIDSDVLDIIENHPDLSDSMIMSLIIHGRITKNAALYG